MKFKPVIGIEIHIELKTKSKMFCGCKAKHFQIKPNTHTCPVCLGLPGALPVPNSKAIDWCLMTGLALNCKISKQAKFDRKNYFYPDLAKGYQISQYDLPFCKQGKLVVFKKEVGITRVHLEEDTGKLVHKTKGQKKYSLIDFNRSGVPLMEIVTEPDISSAEEAVEFLKKLQQIIRFLGVSDCDMEKGSMRAEVNISLAKVKSDKLKVKKIPNYKVEVKNLNSFKFVKKAIDFEIERQKKMLLAGKTPLQETRGFDEKKQSTYSQRGKEEAHDYRYFPEPDIPPISVSKTKLDKLLKKLPKLPSVLKEQLITEFKLPEHMALILSKTKTQANYFIQAARLSKNPTKIAHTIINKRVDTKKFTPRQLIDFLNNQKAAKVSDVKKLGQIVKKVLAANQKAVLDYKKGRKEVIGFLIGQVMKETQGKAEAKVVKELLVNRLK